MKNENRIYIIILALFINTLLYSQPASIHLKSDYSLLTGRNEVTKASGIGGTLQVDFGISENLSAGISIGYKFYSLNQPDQLDLWGWDFWNLRYKNKIDSDLKADPNLSVQIGSEQKMGIIPVMLDLKYRLAIDESFSITPSVSAGLIFFTRSISAIETWSKKFQNTDYIFTYTYKNFAPDKKGNPFAASFGINASYMIFDDIEITGGTSFTYIIPTKQDLGYDLFPLKHELSLNLGINFIY